MQRQKILFTRREYSIDKETVTDVESRGLPYINVGIKIN